MKLIIIPLIVLLTLFFNLGCQSKSGSLSEVNGINSTDTSLYSEDIKPTTSAFKNNFACVQDNDRRIEMSYNENLDTIILSGYGEFKLKNVEEMETARGRPLEFTRYYRNDLGDLAVLKSQAASQYLEVESRKGSKTSYQITLGLDCDKQDYPGLLTYIVDVKKAYIYQEPDLETKTASYFIQGDKVDAISVKEGWIKVSYLDTKKVGWLRSEDLIADRDNTTN